MLVDQGLISAEQLAQALVVQKETEKQLGEVLVTLGFISPGVVANGLAEQHGGPLKTEYGISVGFGGVRPTVEPAAAEVAPLTDVFAVWRTAVEQRDALIERFRATLQQQTERADEATARLEEATSRVASLEAQIAEREAVGESLRVVLAEREKELAAALDRAEESATSLGSDAADRETLHARVQELEIERQRYLAAAAELKAAAVAQAEDGVALDATSDRIAELEAMLQAVAGDRDGLRARVAQLIGERERQEGALAELKATAAGREAELERLAADSAELHQLQARLDVRTAERDAVRDRIAELERGSVEQLELAARLEASELGREELERRLAELIAVPPQTSSRRSYDLGSHLLFIPSPDGYRLLERVGAPPSPGELVEVEDVSASFVVARLGPAPLAGSTLACAYLAEAERSRTIR